MSETIRESVLNEAAKLTTGDRNQTYGSPTQNFQDTADVWNVILGHKLSEKITPGEVASLMIGLKLVRMKAQPKRDNWVDIAGYAACGNEVDVETGRIAPDPLEGPIQTPVQPSEVCGDPACECFADDVASPWFEIDPDDMEPEADVLQQFDNPGDLQYLYRVYNGWTWSRDPNQLTDPEGTWWTGTWDEFVGNWAGETFRVVY